MKESTMKFIEIARSAMQAAYYNEVCACESNPEAKCDWESENAKKIGEVLQTISDTFIYKKN
jgi:hypothetical protein